MPDAKKRPPLPQLVAMFVALGGGAALFGVGFVSALSKPMLLAMCPVSDDGRVGLVVGTRSNGKRATSTDARFQVLDVKSGSRVVDVSMSGWTGTDAPACLGTAGRDKVWLRVPGDTGLEARRLSDGGVATNRDELAKKHHELAAGIQELGWDFDRSVLTLSTRDARRLFITADTFDARPYDRPISMFGLYRGFADGVLKTDVIGYYRGGAPGLVLRDKRSITLQGDDRARLVVAGKPMGGDTFYHPHVLRARDGSVEVAGPPSVLVAEETLVGSLRYRLVRVALDGARLWTFDPETAVPAAWKYRPVPWTLADGGAIALHVAERSVIAVDVASGRLRWKTSW